MSFVLRVATLAILSCLVASQNVPGLPPLNQNTATGNSGPLMDNLGSVQKLPLPNQSQALRDGSLSSSSNSGNDAQSLRYNLLQSGAGGSQIDPSGDLKSQLGSPNAQGQSLQSLQRSPNEKLPLSTLNGMSDEGVNKASGKPDLAQLPALPAAGSGSSNTESQQPTLNASKGLSGLRDTGLSQQQQQGLGPSLTGQANEGGSISQSGNLNQLRSGGDVVNLPQRTGDSSSSTGSSQQGGQPNLQDLQKLNLQPNGFPQGLNSALFQLERKNQPNAEGGLQSDTDYTNQNVGGERKSDGVNLIPTEEKKNEGSDRSLGQFGVSGQIQGNRQIGASSQGEQLKGDEQGNQSSDLGQSGQISRNQEVVSGNADAQGSQTSFGGQLGQLSPGGQLGQITPGGQISQTGPIGQINAGGQKGETNADGLFGQTNAAGQIRQINIGGKLVQINSDGQIVGPVADGQEGKVSGQNADGRLSQLGIPGLKNMETQTGQLRPEGGLGSSNNNDDSLSDKFLQAEESIAREQILTGGTPPTQADDLNALRNRQGLEGFGPFSRFGDSGKVLSDSVINQRNNNLGQTIVNTNAQDTSADSGLASSRTTKSPEESTDVLANGTTNLYDNYENDKKDEDQTEKTEEEGDVYKYDMYADEEKEGDEEEDEEDFYNAEEEEEEEEAERGEGQELEGDEDYPDGDEGGSNFNPFNWFAVEETTTVILTDDNSDENEEGTTGDIKDMVNTQEEIPTDDSPGIVEDIVDQELANRNKPPTGPSNMVLFYTWMVVTILVVVVAISTYQSRFKGMRIPFMRSRQASRSEDKKRLMGQEYV